MEVLIGDDVIDTITEFDGTTITLSDVATDNYNIGDNVITVRYTGSALFDDKQATGTLTLVKRTLAIDVDAESVAKGDVTTITLTLNDTLTDGVMEVRIGDTTVETITSFDATTITLADLATDNYNIGDNTITVRYSDSELFNDATSTGILTLTNRDISITITAPSVAKDDIATITIELNDTTTDGTIELYIDDMQTPIRTITPVTSNIITIDDIDTTGYSIGDHNVLVKYMGSQLYNDNQQTATLTLTDRDLGITVQADTVAKNDKASITIRLNETVTDGVLNVFIGDDGEAIKSITEFDGKEITINNIDTSEYDIGDNTITVIYADGSLFADKTVTSTLTLTKRQLDITATAVSVPKGDNANIILMLNDTPTDGTLEVFINDEQTPIYTSSNFNSRLIVISNVDTKAYEIGDNDVTVKYAGSQLFEDATANTVLTLTDRQVEFAVTADSVIKGDKTRIIIGMNDTLTDGTLNVYINDEEVPIKTITEFDSKLIIIDNVDTSAYNIGDNNVVIKYSGSQLYDDTTASGVLTLSKRYVNIDVEVESVAKGDKSAVTITLNDTLPDGQIEILIGEVPVETITSIDGTTIVAEIDTTTGNIGENTLTVKYTGSELFNDETATATLTLTKRDVAINVIADTVFKGDDTTIRLEFNETLSDGTIKLTVGDNELDTVELHGVDSYTFNNVNTDSYIIGDNTITVLYSTSELYNDKKVTGTLTLKGKEVLIDVQAESVAKGDATTITLTLNDTPTDGQIDVFIGDSDVPVRTVTEFDDTTITLRDVDTSSYDIGDNTVTVKYTGSAYFNENEATATLVLTVRQLDITVEAQTVAKGDKTTITLTLNDTLSDGTLEVLIGDTTVETITAFDDTSITIADVDTASYNIGENTVTVRYTGSELFDDKQATGTLTLTDRQLSINVEADTVAKGDKTTITLTLNDTLSDGTLEVLIGETTVETITAFDDTSITIADVDTASYNIGENTVTVRYTGSELFDDVEATGTLTLNKRDLDIDVQATSVAKGDKTTVTITLNDTLSDGVMEVLIGDTTVETITEFDDTTITLTDVATDSYNIGDNVVTVRYTGSQLFDDETSTGTLTLTKRDISIGVEAESVAKGDVTTITLTLNDTLTDGSLEVLIGDDTVETITSYDGNTITIADVDTSSYNIGDNTITVRYTGSELFNDVDTTSTLTLIKRDVTINVEAETVAKGDKTTITITLNDTLTDGVMEVLIGDTTVETITAFDDTTITLTDVDTSSYPVGENTVTVRYTDSELFNNQEATATLVLTSRDLTMDVQAENVAKGDKSTVTITLNDTLPDGTINVYVNDEPVPVKTITNYDDTTITFDMDTGDYNIGENTITVKYTDSQFYEDTQQTATLTLSTRQVSIKVDNQTAVKNEKTSITITLNDTLTDGVMEVYIADNQVPIATITDFDDKTIIIDNIDTTGYTLGQNTILVKYTGSRLYDDSEATATLTVTARQLDITANAITVPKGDKTSIIIALNDTPDDGVMDIFINDEETPIRTITDFNSKVIIIDNLETSTYDIGDNTVTIKYYDSQAFADNTATTALTLTDRQLDVEISSDSVPKGDVTTITLILNESITDGVIKVFINDESTPVRSINEFNNKLITLTDIATEDYNVGENTVIVKYTGSQLYADGTYEATLILTTRTLAMTVEADTVAKGDVTTITVVLNDTVTDGQLNVFIGDDEVPVRSVTSFDDTTVIIADVDTINYNIGDNTVTVRYADSQLYDDAEITGVLTLIKRDLSIDVSAATVSKGDTTTITLELNDSITDGIITIFIGDDEIPVRSIDTFDSTTIIIADVDTRDYNIGDNTVTVKYEGSQLYNDMQSTATLTLLKRDVAITPTATTVAKGDKSTVTITLNDTLPDGQIEVLIGDTPVETITNIEGTTIVAQVDTTTGNIGDNTLTVRYTGSELFNDNQATCTLTLLNRDVAIKVTADTVFKCDDTTIRLEFNETLPDGTIKVLIGDNEYETVELHGADEYTFNNVKTDMYNIGDNTITVIYSASELYNDLETTGTLTLNARELTIDVQAETVAKGDMTTITLTLNETITDGQIDVYIGDSDVPVRTVTEFDGTIITLTDIDTSSYNIGDNKITVKYSESMIFDDYQTTAILTLNARDITMNVESQTVAKGDVTSITLTLNDTLIGGVMDVFINDEEESIASIADFDSNIITINDIDTSDYNIGENTITIRYTGSDTFDDMTQTSTLTLTKRLVELTTQPISITKGIKQTTMTITFNDTLTDGYIKVYSNNKQIGTVAIKENCSSADVTVYNINIPLGQSDIKIEYYGSSLYANATATTTITNSKIETAVTVEPVILNANRKANITARVEAVGSDVIVNEGKVIFKLNGKTLKDENGKVIYVKVVNGMATLEYSFGSLSNYNNIQITASYAGSTAFETSKSEVVTVQKPAQRATAVVTTDNVTAKIGDKITLNATIKDLDGNNVEYGKVVFKVDGVVVKDANNNPIILDIVDGMVSVDYELTGLKAGNHTICVVMGLDDFYNRSQAYATITVEE